MAHFAQLDDNDVVQRVIVVNNETLLNEHGLESSDLGEAFCRAIYGSDTRWVQTSYSGRIHGNFAGVGFTFDAANQVFVPPRPGPGWTLNASTVQWEPPLV